MLDETAGDVRNRFLDMPVVTVGTASNIFSALKDSLEKHGLEFSKTVAGYAEGFKSSLKKRILNCTYDVGCICHLANITIEAGLKELSMDADKLFVDIFYHFQHSSKRRDEGLV